MNTLANYYLLAAIVAANCNQAAAVEPLPPRALLRLGTLAFRQADTISSVAFMSDSKILATGGGCTIRYWETPTGKELHAITGQQGSDHVVAFSADNKHVAFGAGSYFSGDDGKVSLWDVETRRQVWQVADSPPIWSLAFSQDGKALIVGNKKGDVRCYDLVAGEELWRSDCHSHAIRSLACTADGKSVAANSDNILALIDVETGALRCYLGNSSVKGDPYEGSTCVASARDKTQLAVGCWRSPVQFWDVTAGRLLRTFKGHNECVYTVALSPDGRLLAAGGSDPDVFLWDVQTGKELQRLVGHQAEVRALAFSPDGRTLATAAGTTSRLWDVQTGRELCPLPGHQTCVSSAVFSPDGTRIATAGGRAILLWDNSSGKLRHTLTTTNDESDAFDSQAAELSATAFSPDGTIAVGWGWGKRPYYWDIATGNALCRFPQLTDYRMGRMEFSPNLKTLATWRRRDVQWDSTMHLWDAASGKELQAFNIALPGFRGFDGVVVFSPGGRFLAAGSHSLMSSVCLWETATGKELGSCRPNGDLSGPLCFSPDETLLAAAGRSGQVELWHIASQRHIRELKGPDRKIVCIAFSPDARTIATGDEDGGLRLWEVSSGGQRLSLEGHRGAVRTVSFSPDGRQLISAGDDSTALVWDLTGHLALGARQLSSRDMLSCWTDLASKDATRAYAAIWAIALMPKDGMPLLRKCCDVSGTAAADIERIVASLDAEDFEVRERAARDLVQLGEAAEPILRRTRSAKHSAELRRRVDELLEKLDNTELSAKRLQARRAMEALRLRGGAEANQLLEACARWSSEPWIILEAQCALSRSSAIPVVAPRSDKH
jgi:WD40 repeat protein